ncbi:MAG: DUF4386 domain-containing protein [Candidatus Heimdallarchaeota archaeon]|nr:DUF4386 domain-containing protein [Candidatus Heimdallarchaeota archaeon]
MENTSYIQNLAKLSASFFLLAIVSGIIAAINWGPITESENDLLALAENEIATIIVVLLIMVMALSTAMIAVPLFPILKNYNEGLALAAVVSRIMESIMTIVHLIFILGMLSLSKEYLNAGQPTDAYYELLNTSLFHLQNWTSHFGVIFFNIGAFFYCYIFLRSKLIPRWISILGIVAVLFGLVDVMLMIFGFYAGDFNQFTVMLNLPTLFFELIIAFWLIFRGIDMERFTSLSKSVDHN